MGGGRLCKATTDYCLTVSLRWKKYRVNKDDTLTEVTPDVLLIGNVWWCLLKSLIDYIFFPATLNDPWKANGSKPVVTFRAL